MKISILTLFPNLYCQFFKTSLIKLAIEKGLIEVNLINLVSLCAPASRVDTPTVGPGPGMILKPEIIEKGLSLAEEKFGPGFKIFFSPKGCLLDQILLNSLAEKFGQTEPVQEDDFSVVQTLKHEDKRSNHIILVCARYEGIDHRVEKVFADLLLSIGDYVLLGGDLPCQVFLEGFLRLLPGVVGNKTSIETESFQSPFLDHPEYGLPVSWKGLDVPEVLLSGNHKKIKDWRAKEAARETVCARFDWFRAHPEAEKSQELVKSVIPNHYAALMHSQVIVGSGPGTTSVTSIDLHDIARSCATYGVKKFFVVTPLKDQQEIVKTFISFWTSDEGIEYNSSRFQAVSSLILISTLAETIEKIVELEGKIPLLVATSAKDFEHAKKISYWDQGLVWQQERPILFIFGTGKGLDEELVSCCNFLLGPINGISNYNHLSVRSAVGIILDRWFGLNPKRRHFLPEK